MAKRTRTPRRTASAPAKPQGRQGRPGIVHTSVYLPEAALRGPAGGGLSGEVQNPRYSLGGY